MGVTLTVNEIVAKPPKGKLLVAVVRRLVLVLPSKAGLTVRLGILLIGVP